MPDVATALLALLAVLCCACACVAVVREMGWILALDAALTSTRTDGELARACSRDDDALTARARAHPAHEGEVLISEHGEPALFVGEGRSKVCLACVRRKL